MKRVHFMLLASVALLILASAAPSAACEPEGEGVLADPRGESARVLWTVSGYRMGRQSTMSEEEAKALLFKPLDVTESEIIFNGVRCKGVRLSSKTVDSAEYLRERWQVTPEDAGIADPTVEVIHTDCSTPGFQEYLRLSGSRLVVLIRGVFFYFEPAVNR